MNDIINWESMYETVGRLGIRGYKMKHFDVCSKLWKTKVPKSGQADTLQGEMLRQAEKLRNEACGNGNRNWDDNFAWFCDFLGRTFENSALFDSGHLEKLKEALAYIKDCGEYAAAYNSGKITDEEADPIRFAYTDDDLYDFIEDAVAAFELANPDDIAYEKKEFIYR